MKPLQNGRIIKIDCTIKQYLDSKGGESGEPRILSRGDLCEIAMCPRRWKNGYKSPDLRLPSVEFGSLFDCLLLQPHKFKEYYLTAPPTYETKGETKTWTWKSSTCRNWRAEQEEKGFLVCAEDDLIECKSALAGLLNHPQMGPQTERLISESKHQVFVIAEYRDEATEMIVPVKCLTDIVPNPEDDEFGHSLVDLKTTRSAEHRCWTKSVFENDYHVQAAMNLDCHNAVPGDFQRDMFRHLIVENFKPWEPAGRWLTQEYIDLGRQKYLGALRTYCRCVADQKWPSYSDPMAIDDAGYDSCSPLPYMVQ